MRWIPPTKGREKVSNAETATQNFPKMLSRRTHEDELYHCLQPMRSGYLFDRTKSGAGQFDHVRRSQEFGEKMQRRRSQHSRGLEACVQMRQETFA